jgi:hypothetical protein
MHGENEIWDFEAAEKAKRVLSAAAHPAPAEDGWREGYAAGVAAALREVNKYPNVSSIRDGIKDLTLAPPSEGGKK